MQSDPKAKRQPGSRPARGSSEHTTPFLALLRQYRGPVNEQLRERLKREHQRLAPLGPTAMLLASSLLSLCTRGGKRLRPALVAAGALATGRALASDTVVATGCALELLHAYLLVHDDWMDGDATRRGGPSVHAALRQHFRDEPMGDAAAILVGDWGAAVATDWLLDLNLPPARLVKVLHVFAGMHRAAVVGQQRDVTLTGDNVELTYLLKTASYSTTGPLVMGATMAGARKPELESLREYGTRVGIAFQHRDDLLGVFGDPEETGKPLGSDLRAGKMTSLVSAARSRLRGTQVKTFERAWGNRKATRTEIRSATRVLVECGAKAVVEQRIAELLDEARVLLETGPFEQKGRALLTSLARTLVERST